MVQRELGWLSEAETTLAEAIERFPRDLAAQIDYARLAETRRDRAEALRRWDAVRRAFPDQAAGYTGAAVLLREERRFEEAEALLAEAAERFPDDARLDLDRAMLAHHRRDWAEAAHRWEKVRARLPDERSGYLLGAAALREQKRFDEVQLVLSAGLERFPAEAGLHIEFALLAEARAEWAQAAESWAALRIAFPQDVRGFTFGARALRQLGRTEEADDLLAEATHRFPRDLGVLSEYAWVAQTARDWREAARRWQSVQTQFPDHSVSYIEGAAALRELGRFDEAESLLGAAAERFPEDPRPAIEFAMVAHYRQHWDETVNRWERVRDRFPHRLEGYLRAAIALNFLRRHEEAERLVADAAERFPDSSEVAGQFAWAAFNQYRWADAEARFADILARFPEAPVGYIGRANLHRVQGRFDDAEAILEEGIARLPHNPDIARDYARLPLMREHHLQKEWEKAFSRLEALRKSFPSYEPGWLDSIRYAR
jgi:tetratricopeptide (TPR) repeat protein